MIIRMSGNAKRLTTAGRTLRLGDWGEPESEGSDKFPRLALIRIDDISGGIVSYTLTYRTDDGTYEYKEPWAFGGTFWIEWEK